VLFYLVSDALTNEPDRRRFVHCFSYGDNVMPVFTSPESVWYFLKVSAAKVQEPDQRVCLIKNPFDLVELLAALEANGLKSLFFDPIPDPDGNLLTWGDPILVGEYCSSIEQIRPEFEKLGEVALAQFCRHSHLQEEPFVRWREASADRIAADLRAEIEEWIDCDG
jgi:hypothetical protein